MQMTIVFKSNDAQLSASVDVKDQAEAKKVVGELFATTAKLQNGHRAELRLKGWTPNLTKAQAANRMASALGVTLGEIKEITMGMPKTKEDRDKTVTWPLLLEGTFDACKDLELRLRDLGIQASTKKLGV